MHSVTLIPGDGIGPEITQAAVRVIEASGVAIEWDLQLAGLAAVEKYGTPLPEQTLASLRRTKVALKGPLTTPVGGGFRSVNVALRQEFDLFANVRPALSFPGTQAPYRNVDLVIVRENTEGLYAGVEHFIKVKGTPIAAESIAVVTRAGCERIIDYAFRYAEQNRRQKVTLVHKANILKCTSGLFLEIGREVAGKYPSIRFEERIVDACAMQMVLHPEQFDVLVTTNLFGDILSDLAAGLVGGLGLTAGANIGQNAAIFEPVHGSAPDIAGRGIANPTAMLMAGVMLLDHLGEPQAARRIEQAVRTVIQEGACVTPDLNPISVCTTQEMAEAIVTKLKHQED
ncbi:MAG: isocitrate/isopropylmalate dehydrogenase family protein [Methylohalobius sp.]